MQATSDWDIDGGDDDDRRLAARRLFMYSARALEVATEVSRVFVGHPDVMCCLQGCDRVFQLGRELAVQQGVMIIGPTGVGKTELIRYYRASLPKSNLFEDGLGAVAIRLPVRPHVGQVVGALLRQVRYPLPHVTAPTVAIKTDLLVEALRRNGCRLVFIDEAQHLFSQTRLRSRLTDGTSVSECLRHLMDETPIGLCLAGTDQLLQLQDIDGHLASRLSARFQIQPFGTGSVWRGFVRAFHKQCNAFDLGAIDAKEEADRLHVATGGNARSFKRLLVEAVLVAVDASSNRVAPEHLKLAMERVNGGLSPAGNPYAS